LLSSPFAKKYKLAQNPQRGITLNGGIGGEMQAATGHLQAFQLGKFVFEKLPVLFSQAVRGFSAESYYAGNIGCAILSRFRIVFEKPVAELGLISIRQMFRIEGQEYHLIVKRENENLQMVIKTKSWF